MDKRRAKKLIMLAAKLIDEVRFSLSELGEHMEQKCEDLPYPTGTGSNYDQTLEANREFWGDNGYTLQWYLGLDDTLDQLCEMVGIDASELPDVDDPVINKVIKLLYDNKKLYDSSQED